MKINSKSSYKIMKILQILTKKQINQILRK